MNITQQLADALRAVVAYEDDRPGAGTYGLKVYRDAEDALAAYDAQQARPSADGGKWWRGGDRTCGPNAATFRFIRDDSGIVAYVEGSREQAEERAARIVQCVNAHDTLVSALRHIIAYCVESVPESPCHADLDTLGGKARDALAQAGVHHA